jgi:hypothetical protein
MDLSSFSASYLEAKTRFREALIRAGGELRAYPIDLGTGEDLTIDVGLLGPAGSVSAVVVSSGCHGVEGFFGSATQLQWLKNVSDRTTGLDRRVVLIHAINPFGFAHIRRFNEDNVDLNRNFLRNIADYQGSPAGYESLDGFLNPKSAPSLFEPFRIKSLWNIWRRGLPALKASIAGGQYEFPRGLFFGGKGPCRSTKIIQEHFDSWISPARDVVHIDLHSGLGKSGSVKLLLIDHVNSESHRWFEKTFGRESIQPVTETDGVAYPVCGILGEWIRSQMGVRSYRFAGAEYGTHDIIRVLGAVRRENRCHWYCDTNSNAAKAAKAELLECFCPAAPEWRRQVLVSGVDIIEKCISHM